MCRCFLLSVWVLIHPNSWEFRYRAAQKMDGMAESASNSNPHTTPEQSVAAQSQHHQQFIGEETPLGMSYPTSGIWALRGRSRPASPGCCAFVCFPDKSAVLFFFRCIYFMYSMFSISFCNVTLAKLICWLQSSQEGFFLEPTALLGPSQYVFNPSGFISISWRSCRAWPEGEKQISSLQRLQWGSEWR